MSEPMPHPNLDVVNAVYKAIADGDRAALEALHDPDVVLHVSGDGPNSGDYVGRDEVLGLGVVPRAAAGPETTTVHDVLWSPEHVVVLLTVSVQRDGDELEQHIVQVVHTRGGQVTEIWEYLWDQSADRVFWGRH